MDRLRDALLAVVSQLDPGLPDCLPILDQALVSRGQVARLTPRGTSAQRVYHELARAIDQQWQERFAGDVIGALRLALEPLATAPDGRVSPLLRGPEPYPDNWRARVRPPATLPHYPMVLHRGGYPDGS